MSTKTQGGFVFNPALQDISLKRFRLRYCTYNDCYYLHWDNAVCPPLARKEGFASGLLSYNGIQRRMNKYGEVYLTADDTSDNPSMQWHMDFSTCGLVVRRLEVKVRCGGEENMGGVNFTLRGDDTVYCSPLLGDQPVEVPQVQGCKSVTLTASLHPEFVMGSLKVLNSSQELVNDCPLDIIVELMCPRTDEFDVSFVGELLLGVKFAPEAAAIQTSGSPGKTSGSNGDPQGELANGQHGLGQLQVHVVEGAGLIDQETFKPYNSYVRCDLLPDIGRHAAKQTSPRHNAYPTWTKEFVFTDLSYQDLVHGGLEVTLRNHHTLTHDSMIGGVRLCVPLKKPTPDSSPTGSRSYSPVGSDSSPSPNELTPMSAMFDQLDISCDHHQRNSCPNPYKYQSLPLSKSMNSIRHESEPIVSPVPRRARSPSPHGHTAHTLSPVIRRRNNRSQSPNQKTSVKNFFRLSGSHLLEAFSAGGSSSAHSSPILSRRKNRQSSLNDSEYVFRWMEGSSEGGEKHWQQVLGRAGDWVYFWHVLQPKLN